MEKKETQVLLASFFLVSQRDYIRKIKSTDEKTSFYIHYHTLAWLM